MNEQADGEKLFWELADELSAEDLRVGEGTIMNSRCLRVGDEFLALLGHKGSGMVVKLPRERVDELIDHWARGAVRPGRESVQGMVEPAAARPSALAQAAARRCGVRGALEQR